MYRLGLVLWVASVAAQSPYDSLEGRSSYPGKPTSLSPLYTPGLGAASHAYRDNSYEDNAVTPTPAPQPLYRTVNPGQQNYQNQQAIRVGGGGQRGGPQSRFPENSPEAEELVEEEKDEPDRLTLLLPQSKFDCVNKQTGYYADEDLNCEVFHYCHENAKHSWICPEGFTFHQVHLICMPPSGDISCKKSSQYHFVNEYLYKPLNQQEADNKPNVTLRYSERYFPADIYTDERDAGDYHGSAQQQSSQRRPLPQQVFLGQQSTTINSLPTAARAHQPQPLPQYRLPVNQVFRSPEEVNIPLQQRRPQLQQQQQHILRRFPQVRPEEEDYE
ncbi:uncharacterized protein [Venturia canescens]|uniref:uncharacterized protein isoform X2 n=1 Tax=Venturia canescens TaxID=32260 RepID=UPI001C9C866D|nr:uncharacterized protein LOC122414541 isoform X2 [Venturia canescens]